MPKILRGKIKTPKRVPLILESIIVTCMQFTLLHVHIMLNVLLNVV